MLNKIAVIGVGNIGAVLVEELARRCLARNVAADAPTHDRVIRLRDEAERMLSLMERFQRSQAALDR